jgi:hypothetical protein
VLAVVSFVRRAHDETMRKQLRAKLVLALIRLMKRHSVANVISSGFDS